MRDSCYDILFAVIAMRDVVFFANVADELKKNGYKTAFITFYEPGDDYLIKRGYDVYSIHKSVRGKEAFISEEVLCKLEKEYQLQNIRELLLHEKLTFNRHNEEKLLRKAILYFNFFSELFGTIKTDFVVQELGGFIAQLTLFYSCLKFKVNHLFLEPAMYKGRLFITANAMNCSMNRREDDSYESSDYVHHYLEDYHKNKTVATPAKDLHHFKDTKLKKLINMENIEKLVNKVKNKYVKSLSEEFDAIGNHILRFTKMYFNRRMLTKFYKDMEQSDKFIYYPFHVPLDFQLTVRSNQFLDQISLLKYISDVLPYGLKLYVKEHPAAIGAYKSWEINELLQNKNVRMIHPSVNSYDLISRSKCVITINSKVGVEALFQRKRVIVLGDAFYRGKGLTIDVDSMTDLKTAIKDSIVTHMGNDLFDSCYMKFFEDVYQSSFSGELYVNDKKNIANFSNSLLSVLNEEETIKETAN